MRPELKAFYTPAVVAQAMTEFDVRDARLLSDWHAATYAGERPDGGCVVRLSHSAHRTRGQIEAELAWMRELVADGIAAPSPLRSQQGNFAESCGPEGVLTAAAFSLLRGREIGPDDWNPLLFRQWGRLIGRLHRHSARTRPSHARPQWFESDFLNLERYIPDAETTVKEKARALIARFRALPVEASSFGLIHADVYQENLRLLDDGTVELFDFDNCEYGWFVSDIAIALYASLWRVTEPALRPDFARRFLDSLLEGYELEHHLPDRELGRLNDFLRLRDVLIYTVGRKQLDQDHLTPFQARLMHEHRTRIAAGTPIVDLAF